jgi:hypothetical protein
VFGGLGHGERRQGVGGDGKGEKGNAGEAEKGNAAPSEGLCIDASEE